MPGVAPGTIVTTASGHIPVETVTVGMLALAGDSTWQPVAGIECNEGHGG